VITDPSSNHNGAWSLREPNTGKWLIRSPDYVDWMKGSTSFLWLYGIPGSGKTILASFVVEDVKEFCKSTALNGWAYYYFYFRREKDEVPHFLCWVINQLCRQSKYIPPEVQELHRHGGEPGTASLLIALSAVLTGFQQVYLILDALDESTNRPQLLDVLIKLSSDANFAKLRILATSRKEQDIERALRGISTVISLNQNQWVDNDIRFYIQSRLREDRKLSRWPEALRSEIEVALVKGAMGM
jgi:Cdc6-like AAA superfamily ATPase